MIARLVLGLAVLLALAGCGTAADRDWPEPSPALWEVTSPEGQKAWLFGTVHALPAGAEWRTPAVDDAFSEAGLLVVEIAELGDQAASFPVFQRLAYSPGLPALTARVSGEEREAVEALLEQAGANEADYAEMESWAAAMVLAGGVRSGDPELGVDRQLLGSGKQAGKQAMGLESYEQQFALFDSLPQTEQDDLLVAVAREAAGDPAQGLRLWLAGDMDGLEVLGNAGMLGDPELREALLDARNRDWVVRIAPLVGEGRRPFVAVGAAHMLGDGGLPALLAARGFTVRRIQ
ncbi:TraB/GumN family protein [Altererythrobacter sp. KTW20L]|uniref:TraB/GumN family protein n=1 Tax=Altererythrobacter sp. KTW20L TaxID=2942210 RepID=UPI0020C09DA7|nr:TraB/GumN family protein [Altererythrobacter sp. KTW20L]MCL6251986.1 TraB/GumN family protein [Altererythrobacter sp. KTW20L]